MQQVDSQEPLSWHAYNTAAVATQVDYAEKYKWFVATLPNV